VNFAAEQFLRAPSWREHIAQVIGRLGRATRVSRVYIFENRHTETNRLVWRQIYEWVATGVSTQIDNPVLQEFDVLAQGFERWIALMEKGELIKGKVKDLPPGEQAELVAEEIKSIVCVPIFVKQVWWGFIGFDDCLTEREWSAAELDALIAAASTLGAAIEREQSDREQQMRANELEAIRQASLSLTATLDLGTVLETVCESTLRLTPEVNDVHIFLYPGERLEFGASLWMDGKKNVMWSEPRPDGLTYTVARSGKRIVVPDMRTSPLFAAMQWRGAIIGMPLKIAQRVVGVMTIAYEKPRTFSENELRTLDLLAAQAAIAIENASLYDQVQQLAVTDPLTNIYNRRGFFQIGDSEIERARRFGHPLSALMFDLDYFKQFNDTFGHPFGDKILVALVEVCRRNIRTLDILGRYGGEEFAVLLPETDSATAVQIAERVREAVEKTQMQIDDRVISITISIGVATLHDGVFDLTALLDQADQALYRAKQAGRNRVELFTPLG
jgi:diguanylate cyclase (GGDEF)-like protein